MSRLFVLSHVAARLLAIALAVLIMLLAVGQGFHPANMTVPETLQFVALLLSLIGLVVMAIPPFRRSVIHAIGAALSLAGIIVFYILNFLSSGQWPGGWVFPLFFVPGVVELLSASLERSRPQ